MAAFGLAPCPADAPAPEVFYLWPELVPGIELFVRLSTQWRHGFNGPTGLDYVAAELELRREPRAARDQLRRDLRTLERATLAEWARQRQAQEARGRRG